MEQEENFLQKRAEGEGNLEIARLNFKRWNEALLAKNPEKVAQLYALNATLLPTLSPVFRVGREQIQNYFEHFLQKNPAGKVVEEQIQFLGQGYAHSGNYDFTVGPENARQTINARFTFIWGKNEKGEWQILHHHSSLMPAE